MSDGKDQGWFENDADYRRRKRREADEATVERTTGEDPAQGFLESEEDYEARVRREADEGVVDAGSSTSGRGFFEGEDAYGKRISREAREETIKEATGAAPSKGFFEGEDAYEERLAREADEATVERVSGSKPAQGFFESQDAYEERVAQEAAEHKSSERGKGRTAGLASRVSQRAASAGSGGGPIIGLIKLVAGLFLLVMAVAIGLYLLIAALAVGAVAALAQFAYAEAVRRNVGPAVRLYRSKGTRVVWVGAGVGLLFGLLFAPGMVQGGDAFGIVLYLAGLAVGGYAAHRVSSWISRKRLGGLDPIASKAELIEPRPALLYGIGGALALTYVGTVFWLATLGAGPYEAGGSSQPGASAESATELHATAPDTESDERGASGSRADEQAAERAAAGNSAPAGAPRSVYADVPDIGFLTIRSEPSTAGGERLGALPHRAEAQVLGTDPVPATVDDIEGRWLHVRHDGVKGWIFDGYARSSRPPPIETLAVDAWATVDEPGGDHLNVREWSSVGSRIKGTLPQGSRVRIDACRPETMSYSSGTPGRWCRVRQGTLEGWTFDAHLRRTDP